MDTETDMHGEKITWRRCDKMTIYKPRREAWNRLFPHKPQKKLTLWTLRFWTSKPSELAFRLVSHQSSETITQDTKFVLLCYVSLSKLMYVQTKRWKKYGVLLDFSCFFLSTKYLSLETPQLICTQVSLSRIRFCDHSKL